MQGTHVGNVATPTLGSCGMTASFRVISVTIPRGPSDPTKMPLRLYPADDFRGRFRVLMTLPTARTMVRLSTHSLIVPYLMAFVPDDDVPIMPPIIADGPGSTGKNNPVFRSALFRSIQPTDGWTTTSISSSC